MIGVAMMRKLMFMLLLAAVLLGSMMTTGVAQSMPEYDGPPWEFEVELKDIIEDFLRLASAADPLAADYEPKDLTPLTARRNDVDGNNTNDGIYMAAAGTIHLRKQAANALFNLVNAAEADGLTLYVRAGYRDYADQEKRYARAERQGDTATTQKAGECDYQTGLAVTLVNREYRGKTLEAKAFAKTAESKWLQENAARFGFIVRYPDGKDSVTGWAWEPWHLRFVGVSVARYIRQNNLTLEEFRTVLDGAYDEFRARGGDVETAIAASRLPDGPVVLAEMGPDGDNEIILFHD